MDVTVRRGGAAELLACDDAALLKQCRVDTYRASGPGGQHRNRTLSAVRLTHMATGISVTGQERRSQHENRRKALARLRLALALQVRSPDFQIAEEVRAVFAAPGPVRVSSGNEQYPRVCAAALDALLAARGSLGAAAGLLGTSTGRLARLLGRDGDLLTAANRLRQRFGLGAVKIAS